MDVLMSLWLPILISGAAVFIASFLAWVVMPHHKPDFKVLKEEEKFKNTLVDLGLKTGVYMFPGCEDKSQWNDPEYRKVYMAGPHGMLSIWAGPVSMGRNLGLSLIFNLFVSFMAAYVASFTLAADASFASVFRVTGTVTVMAYSLGFIPNAIWFGRTLRSTLMDVIDGVVYGLVTGAIFGLCW